MKIATIPPVRIDEAFRAEIEQSLMDGESLAALVETAVRTELHRRKSQLDFVQRGLAAIERCAVAGDGLSTNAVLLQLEQKLAAARAKKA